MNLQEISNGFQWYRIWILGGNCAENVFDSSFSRMNETLASYELQLYDWELIP